MRTLLLTVLLLVCAAGAQGQVSSSTAKKVVGTNTLPATCTAGPNPQVYVDTNATAAQQFYVCTSTNTWTAQGGSGGSGTVTSIATTSPITGGIITATGTIACATCATSAASLTSTALVTGAGSQALQTAAATATMDSSGNVSTPGSVSTGVGGAVAGSLGLAQGTATSVATNTIQFQAPTSVTGYNFVFPAAAFSGLIQWTNSSNVLTGTNATAVNVSAPQFCADAGANDTYACSLAPTPTLVTGTHYRFSANTANTGAATINFNTLGAKTIVKVAGGITTALADNDIRAGQWVDLVYDGTNMQMQSTLGNAGGGGISGLTTNTLPVATSSTAISNSFFVQGGDATNPTFRFGAADTSHTLLREGGGQLQLKLADNSGYAGLRSNGLQVDFDVTLVTSGINLASNRSILWSDTPSDNTGTKDSGVGREGVNVIKFTDGGAGYGAFKGTTGTLTTLASDAATTNNTVCVQATTGLLLKGSGTLGICLGTSSARFKHGIRPMGNALGEVLRLRPKRFFYNDGYGDSGARENLGFIAEDVARQVPELARSDASGQPSSVDMLGMVPKLVRAIQELNAKVDMQAKEIRRLRRTRRK